MRAAARPRRRSDATDRPDHVDQDLGRRGREVTGAQGFDFELKGDVEGSGRALSLVFANTPSTGARLQLSSKRPTMPHLELSV